MKNKLENIVGGLVAGGILLSTTSCAPVMKKFRYDMATEVPEVVMAEKGYWSLDGSDDSVGSLRLEGTNWIATSKFKIGEMMYFPITYPNEKKPNLNLAFATNNVSLPEPHYVLDSSYIQSSAQSGSDRNLYWSAFSTTNLGKGAFIASWYDGKPPHMTFLNGALMFIPGVNMGAAMYLDKPPEKTVTFTIE